MDTTFRTVLAPQPSDFQIEHQSGVLSMGSCFAENMAKRLMALKFQTQLNPFGIIYNPISIAQGLSFLSEEHFHFDKKALVEHQGNWHSFHHHGCFSKPEKEMAIHQMNAALNESRKFLSHAKVLILTLGTANVYVDQQTKMVVANCHQIPQQFFERKKLKLEQIIEKLGSGIEKIKTRFPQLKIIITISPVRHTNDGLIENQISKAKLILAAQHFSEQYAYVSYFPAYELLLDDLRDYRFYQKDLVHPSETAVDYIWNFFEKTFFTPTTMALNSKIEKIKMAVNHRPFQPQSEAHLNFQKKQIEKMEALEKEFPFLDFEEEKNIFQS